MSLALSLLAIVAGLALLVWGADRFVLGAASLARTLGVSPLVIGITVVGFGTSAPELLISTIAALEGTPQLAVGNAIGSNIANIALILGVTALIAPLAVHSKTLRHEFPLLLGVSLLTWWLLADGTLGRIDGLLLLVLLLLVMAWLVWDALHARPDDPLSQELVAELEQDLPPTMSTGRALMWFLIGLVVLVASSRMLVWGAVNIAHALGVSDLVIGLTIVALGTSLPELAASIVSARRGEADLALGNVLGSNLFNTLGVLGLPGLIHPAVLEAGVLDRDLPVMLALTVLLFAMAYGFRGPGRINRWEGGFLLACFAGYQWYIYQSIQTTAT